MFTRQKSISILKMDSSHIIGVFILILTSCVLIKADVTTTFATLKYNTGDLASDNFNGSWDAMLSLVSNLSSQSPHASAIRPKREQSEAVQVTLTFYLNAVVDFTTVNQKIDVMGYFRVEWTDEIIPWDPDTYGGMNVAIVPKSLLWYPRLIIDKTYGTAGVVGDSTDMVKIDSNGTVRWAPNGIYSWVCDVNTMFYPFDPQICNMEIYVSDHTRSQVDLQTNPNGGALLKEYTENVEWKLVGISSTVYEKYETNFVSVRIVVERRSSFTVYTMLIPLLTLSLLSATSYLVPVHSGEKIGLAITIFLTYGFFVAVTRDSIPADSTNTPYMVRYISTMMILSMISVLYAMVESKILTSMGTKVCPVRCLNLSCFSCISRQFRRGQVDSINDSENVKNNTNSKATRIDINGSQTKTQTGRNEAGPKRAGVAKTGSESEQNSALNNYTYEDFLSHMDIVLFLINLFVLLILNTVIWVIMATRYEL